MAERKYNLGDWKEPAHPSIIKYRDDLLTIYRQIKERQNAIDQAFDEISRKIGFVVTSTIPIVVTASKGVINNVEIGAENLKGTLFEEKLLPALASLKGMKATITDRQYAIYLLWFNALKLKLRTDWMEPAHFRTEWMEPAHPTVSSLGQTKANVISAVRPEVMEPAHWFDPRVTLEPEETVLISVLDEVYPELNLAARISSYRQRLRAVKPEVMEPAHFRTQMKDPAELVKALKDVLERYSQ